jgi:outer membrane protein assembly factor BamB
MTRIRLCNAWRTAAILLLGPLLGLAADWPQFRGPSTDGISPETISTTWPVSGPGLVWTNGSLTNGFSTFAVSQGRAFTLISKRVGGTIREYCVAVDAATGAQLWETPFDIAPWDPGVSYNGGDGAPGFNTGDGPRTTPAVSGDRVIAFSGLLKLVCMNVANGSVIWSNDLISAFGGSIIVYENASSPCVDNDLIYVNLNTSTNNKTLAAFRVSDGSLAWSALDERVTHTTPVIATMHGVRQVIFATTTGLVGLDRTTGTFLWKFTYPFYPISTSMGASPVVYSNMVYCTASYGRGATAARVNLDNGSWSVQQLYLKTGATYRSIWMTPVCHEGYIYTLSGDNSSFLTTPLHCIELSTGNLMWSTNGFGMGGLILVGTNLLALKENGQLVLARATPTAYEELGSCQAFQFSTNAPGKCWISPAFSNGRIYVRSTRGGVCLDASVSVGAALKLSSPRFLSSTQLELLVGTADGSPLDAARLAKIEIHESDRPGLDPLAWQKLTNQLVMDPIGRAQTTITINPGQARRFYRAVEMP